MILSSTWRTLVQATRGKAIRPIHLAGIDGTALPFVVASLAAESGKNILLLTAESESAEEAFDDLRAFWGQEAEMGPVLHLPLPFLSPYIGVSTDRHLELEALGALTRLACEKPKVVVAWSGAAANLYPHPSQIRERSFALLVDQEVDREQLLARLTGLGYSRVTTVAEPGTFAVRGGLLDLWSPAENRPLRLDFFGDEIDAMGTFDPSTQLTVHKKLRGMRIAPVSPLISAEHVGDRIKALRALNDELSLPSTRLAELVDALRAGETPSGIEAILPLLYGQSGTLFDYLDADEWLVVVDDESRFWSRVERWHETERDRYRARVASGKLALPPERRFLTKETLSQAWAGLPRINTGVLDTSGALHLEADVTKPIQVAQAGHNRWAPFEVRARQALRDGFRTVVVAPDPKEAQRVAHQLVERGLAARYETPKFQFEVLDKRLSKPAVEVYVGALANGAFSDHHGVLLVTHSELYEKQRVRRKVPSTTDQTEQLFELQEGDFVVHREYGIGRFDGIERRNLGTGEYPCLKLVYGGGDTVYVPVNNSGAVQRFIGTSKGDPKLDKLGSNSWQNRVSKARTAAKKLAFDLLALYARRQAAKGYGFSPGDDYFADFEASFPYEETPDQRKAIEDVIADMEKPEPMDRLVCGDVGFGKTEVAIRAAFKAVLDGRQVAILVPTTILAEQHCQTFRKRLQGYPVKVDTLSRFKSKGEQNVLLKEAKEGKVDILIGTHRLLGKDIVFRDLGLLVVDEEHRFGVGHKERLKEMRAAVDVLSMTATPIPRTLHMALSGIRDLSVIKTAPLGRQDVETQVIHFDANVITEAIRRELAREGQVFVLHNRVDDLGELRDVLKELVPEARFAVAHGQMNEEQLEKVMVEFIQHQHDVLVCTTIIESGLDIPAANTLIVNHADRFGLAQLYQIRGRVGRSAAKAHAYFIVPPLETMPTDARSRLAALTRYTAVGSGMQVAMVDMELRGVGDLLGAEQSGNIGAVGIELYSHLVGEAVEELRSQNGPMKVATCEVDVPVEAQVPEGYVPDRHQRLVLYRAVAACDSLERLERLRTDTLDRYGPMPDATVRLLEVAEVRLMAELLGITKLSIHGGRVKAVLREARDEVLQKALGLIRQPPVPLQVSPDSTLTADFSKEADRAPLTCAKRLLGWLGITPPQVSVDGTATKE